MKHTLTLLTALLLSPLAALHATERPSNPGLAQFQGIGPLKGGFGKGALGRKGVTDFKSVDHSIQNWVKANGCNAKPDIVRLPDKTDDGMKVTRKTWGGGKEGSEVVLIEIEGGGHTCPA